MNTFTVSEILKEIYIKERARKDAVGTLLSKENAERLQMKDFPWIVPTELKKTESLMQISN